MNDIGLRPFNVGRMRRQLEHSGSPIGRKARQHDRDGCGICHEVRVRRLRKKGLATGLAKYLIDAGTVSAPQVAALECATRDQLAAIGNAYGTGWRAVPVGDRGQQT